MRKNLLFVFLVLIIFGAVFAGFLYFRNLNPSVPKEISSQADFPILYPKNKVAGYAVPKESIKFHLEKGDKGFQFGVVNFIVKRNDTEVTIAEQAYPEILVFDKFVGALQQYDEAGTSLGKVYLTHPKELKGGQTAVLNSNNSTLLFAKPNRDLTKEEWQEIFNSLEVVK